MFTKIINEETRECLIMNQVEAKDKIKQLELKEMEVEAGYDGKMYLKGYAPQKPQELINQEKINKYKQYLAETDYIMLKISEAIANNDEELLAELKDKYADVFVKRKEARENINALESEIESIERRNT